MVKLFNQISLSDTYEEYTLFGDSIFYTCDTYLLLLMSLNLKER